MKKISAIIPVYNSEKYLDRCLESLINQTLKDIEIILINDGSKDNSLLICKKYAKCDKRIILINKENEGVSIARNKGLEIATGEYITYLDSDDYLELNAFEEMYNIAINTNADIVLFNHYNGNSSINNVKFPKNKLLKGNELTQILKNANTDFFIPYCWRNIFKNTDKQKQIKFKVNLKFGEDSLYNLESYLNAESMYCSDKAFYHYMPNPYSTMNNKKKNFLFYLENLYNEKMNLYDKMGLDDFKQDLYNYTIQHTLNILIIEQLNFTKAIKLKESFKKIGESKMIIDSFKNCNINIDDTNMRKINKKVSKYIKNKKYLHKYIDIDLIYIYIIYIYKSNLQKIRKNILNKN